VKLASRPLTAIVSRSMAQVDKTIHGFFGTQKATHGMGS
jgi:hypothetical protein